MLDLESIELIKQLKARYFRGVDTCNIELLKKTVFTPDAKIHFISTTYDLHFEGWREQLEDFYRNAFTATKFGMHLGHMPEITVNGDHATGLWYLHDIFFNLDVQKIVEGSAIYEDEYVRLDGEWRIRSSRYERLLEFIKPLPPSRELAITSKPIKPG